MPGARDALAPARGPLLLPSCSEVPLLALRWGRGLRRLPSLGAQSPSYLRFLLNSYCFLIKKTFCGPACGARSGVQSMGWAVHFG